MADVLTKPAEKVQKTSDFPLIFERSQRGRRAARPPEPKEVDVATLLGEENLRDAPPRLPEVSELELVRHYTGLAHRQFSIDGNPYPLGSCTMKYNPKVNEEAAKLFDELHPYQDPDTVQGALELLYNLQHALRRNHRDGRGQPPARGGRARRAHGHPHHPRFSRGQRRGRTTPRGHRARRGARYEPRHRRDGRLRGGGGADGRGWRGGLGRL